MRRRFATNNIKPINTNNYMTVVALEDDLVVTATLRPVSYCIDGDGVWVNIANSIGTPPIKKGQKISFKQIYNGIIDQAANRFSISKRCNLEGNCNSLVYGDMAIENSDLRIENAFRNMFMYNDTIIEVSDDFLPATSVSLLAYSSMFAECSNLIKAPKLPATHINPYSYFSMFSNCISLIKAPELPATECPYFCYGSMFSGCKSLVTAPELPATLLEDYCYQSMFKNCTSLTQAPELPATTLINSCYSSMFYGCSSLNHIKMLAADISAAGCLGNWVRGVSPTGTFVKNPDATWEVYGDSGIPNGWTVKMDGEEDSGSLIEFAVKNYFFGGVSTYQAKEGMTWTEWVNSSYNTDGYFLELEGGGRYKIVSSDKMWFIVLGGATVWGDETIINNNEYQLDFY